MLHFLFSIFLVDPAFDKQAFKHFKKSGNEAVCLVDYQQKTVDCSYKTMALCREQYGKDRRVAICFPRKDVQMDGDIQ